MDDVPPLYIANIGMVTPIGANTAMSYAAFKAGISAYTESDFFTPENQRATLAHLPLDYFREHPETLYEADYFNEMYEHIIVMAMNALAEVLTDKEACLPLQSTFTFPEPISRIKQLAPQLFFQNILQQEKFQLPKELIRVYRTGRAGVLQAIELAHRYMESQENDYALIGASDSYFHLPLIQHLAEDSRVLTKTGKGGFAPGEGACFLLLTKNPDLAMQVNNAKIALHLPGISQEQGHFYSDTPYRGEGLDLAYKSALKHCPPQSINKIFSSMNGEDYWTKEFGVARMRNHAYFDENADTEHPADSLGDTGAAAGGILLGLAAMELFHQPQHSHYLVQSSSDGPSRAAVVLERKTMA
ncbi:hypothetical protein TDB9533_03483 [Thalassocella blandensis]|nr:hypothetical protein TDB9533_03483 [Thalassocella blandensis]